MSTPKRRGLGRGLDALLSTSQAARDRVDAQADGEAQSAAAIPKGEMQKLPIEQLEPGKYQPRKDMSPEALEELAHSIEAQGIIQPIVVRKVASGKYEIIAGERRWRASQLAGLDIVPCMVKDVPDEAAVAIALIENIQREDLNAMEEAIALKRLMTEFQLTHQETADAVGKSRTTVTNLLRLNNLNDDVKVMLERGDIEMGHARALLTLEGEQQSEAARIVVGKGMTVREAERLVRKIMDPPEAKPEPTIDPNITQLQTDLAERLGANVMINHTSKGKGKLVISYTNLDELDGILEHIK
ncbi:ParB/RepB/Spo0J family partition protein [Corallincola spongiicola]|uniref:Probable chromosome-partitioning protein ParB n=1 Tax=Corallincola spongiicola TaxID=2520508 RepID=A0ABY1WLD6_9GAMM|nr:ParB/RepB/Spo0J family partition protein [Corallincola spongiicola]TAA41072.1 ParB/RepB/Spo0J family partition protein [Corallincola spongiicola]